jgi:ubiquitin carboxyl-terminal hydrolase 25/28
VDESTGREALKIIAEARQSHVLLTFLETGTIETPMETGAAYARLGTDDRSIPDDLVISVFNFRVSLNRPILSRSHILK